MNCPRIWQHFAVFFKLDQRVGVYFGLINIILYVIGFFVFTLRTKLSFLMGFFLLATFFSPASILAMERGNIDMIIFFLPDGEPEYDFKCPKKIGRP